jgi:methylthioribose-1-phosphate isomerase
VCGVLSFADYILARIKEAENVQNFKEDIMRKCEELLPRDVRDNKVMGNLGAQHILNRMFFKVFFKSRRSR